VDIPESLALLVAEVTYCHDQFHMDHPAGCCFSCRLVRCP
jgi:hypothetical protein